MRGTAKPDPDTLLKAVVVTIPHQRKRRLEPPMTIPNQRATGVDAGSPSDIPKTRAIISRKGCQGITRTGKRSNSRTPMHTRHCRIKSSRTIQIKKAPSVYPHQPNQKIQRILIIPKVWFVVIIYLILTPKPFPSFREH